MRDRARHPAGPVTPEEPIELRIALGGVALTLVLGALAIAVAAQFQGRRGMLGAGIGVAVVAGTLLLSGALLSLAARFGPAALFAAALGGYTLKLCVFALLMVLLGDVDAIDGPSLAITAATLLLVSLAWQTRRVLRDRRLFWVAADAALPAAGAVAGVVYTSGRESPPLSSDPRSTERTSA